MACNEMASLGLMYYNARWYDPALGRFASADTIGQSIWLAASKGAQSYDLASDASLNFFENYYIPNKNNNTYLPVIVK